MAKVTQDILTAKALAAEMEITTEAAQTLMTQEDFPATEIAPNTFVVARGLFETWVRRHSKGYIQFDADLFMNK